MAKDYIILCLDVGPSMSIAPPSGGETHLEMAMKVANQIVQQKMFAGSKDFVGLVLFGTPETNNELSSTQGGYDNISVVWEPAQPSLEFLQYLHSQIQAGDVSADFIDAIVVSMDLMVRSTMSARRVGDKKIYLLTDAGSGYSDDGLTHICTGLKEKNIELIVVGPDLDDGSGGAPDGNEDDDEDRQGKDTKPSDSSVMKKTAQQLAGERVLSQVIQEVDGASFTFMEAVQVATFIRKLAKRQTSRFTGHLEIGSELKIPCKMFTKTMTERPTNWKKLSAISQASAASGTMDVKMERSYHLNDEDETEVEGEDVAKGYRYGKSLVPISDADEQAMKFVADRSLSVMGFTSTKNIKLQHVLGSSVLVVVPNPEDEHAAIAMSSLIHALYEMDMVGIVRCVMRKNSQPKLMGLVPHIKAEYECLMMVQLPFMEDVRQYTFGSVSGKRKQFEPSQNQFDAVDNLITSMNLIQAEVGSGGESCESLQAKFTCNPIMQRIYQCIHNRALNPDDHLPDVDANLTQLLQPTTPVLAECSGHIDTVKAEFPLTKVDKRTEGGKAADVWKITSDLNLDTEATSSKKMRTEEETDFSMASLARGRTIEVGTLDPVHDYYTLIRQKDTHSFGEASKQLQGVVFKFVKESFGDAYYEKALDCVKAFREEAIKFIIDESTPDIAQDESEDADDLLAMM